MRKSSTLLTSIAATSINLGAKKRRIFKNTALDVSVITSPAPQAINRRSPATMHIVQGSGRRAALSRPGRLGGHHYRHDDQRIPMSLYTRISRRRKI